MKIIKQAHKMFSSVLSHLSIVLFGLVYLRNFPPSPIMEDCGQNDPFRDYDVNTHQGYVFTLRRGDFPMNLSWNYS